VNLEAFIDTRFMLPTSNDCERLFSKVVAVNLESQLFLNVNNDLWSGKDILNLPE